MALRPLRLDGSMPAVSQGGVRSHEGILRVAADDGDLSLFLELADLLHDAELHLRHLLQRNDQVLLVHLAQEGLNLPVRQLGDVLEHEHQIAHRLGHLRILTVHLVQHLLFPRSILPG